MARGGGGRSYSGGHGGGNYSSGRGGYGRSYNTYNNYGYGGSGLGLVAGLGLGVVIGSAAYGNSPDIVNNYY
jgi:hypothetical protein